MKNKLLKLSKDLERLKCHAEAIIVKKIAMASRSIFDEHFGGSKVDQPFEPKPQTITEYIEREYPINVSKENKGTILQFDPEEKKVMVLAEVPEGDPNVMIIDAVEIIDLNPEEKNLIESMRAAMRAVRKVLR
jgi:hypothetical protein